MKKVATNNNNTIEQLKAWLTPGLLAVVSWYVIDLKNDVKLLLDRTARLEVQLQYVEKCKDEKQLMQLSMIHHPLIFDRPKILTLKTCKHYEYL